MTSLCEEEEEEEAASEAEAVVGVRWPLTLSLWQVERQGENNIKFRCSQKTQILLRSSFSVTRQINVLKSSDFLQSVCQFNFRRNESKS